MQITLTEREIHAALRKYIIARLRLAADEEIKVDLMATRGIDGFKAVLDIIEPDDTAPVEHEVQPEKIVPAPAPTVTLQFQAAPVKQTVPAIVAPVAEVINQESVEDTATVAPKLSGLFAHLAV